jgi:ribose transport system permease protein
VNAFLNRHARVLIPTVALVVLLGTFLSIHPRGASTYVLTIWANQGTLLGLAAIAQFFVVLVRGVDLSVGSVVALTNVVASYLLIGSTGEIAFGIIAVLAIGMLCGFINGAAVVYGRIQPIVATLASGSVFSGIALLLRPTPGGSVDEALSDALTYDIGGVPTSAILLVIVLFLVALPLRKSRLGLSMYAVGSAEPAAYMTGIRVNAVKLSAYTAGGFFGAMTGLAVSMVTLTGDAAVGPSYTLNSIAAVVLGGVALSGGVGGPLGAVIGALVLKTVSSLIFFSGLPPLAQPFFEGAILAAAIGLGAMSVFRVSSKLDLFGR